MSRYKASLIGGQNIVLKPYIDVSVDSVRFKIPGIFSGDEQTIQIDSITEVRISGTIISKTIEIYTSGMGVIRAEGFSASDARGVKDEIEANRANLKRPVQQVAKQRYETREDDDRTDSMDVSRREMENKRERFTNKDLIPLITFEERPKPLLEALNALATYAKETGERQYGDSDAAKLKAYTEKINEGLRTAYRLGLDKEDFYGSEIKRLELVIRNIEFKQDGKKKKERSLLTVSIIFSIVMIVLMWKGCTGCYHYVKEWADSPKSYSK